MKILIFVLIILLMMGIGWDFIKHLPERSRPYAAYSLWVLFCVAFIIGICAGIKTCNEKPTTIIKTDTLRIYKDTCIGKTLIDRSKTSAKYSIKADKMQGNAIGDNSTVNNH